MKSRPKNLVVVLLLNKRPLPVIFSLAGLALTDGERDLFREAAPLGIIIFGRNCESPAQLRALTSDVREVLGWDCPVLIDQEGGRVQRLKPPHWQSIPPMKKFGESGEAEALRTTILHMARELKDCGITVNCAPVLDVLTPETHEAIGDRAFGADPVLVGRLGLVVCEALLEAGITPVIKHLPGHGRATLDSHKALPRVSEALSVLDEIDFDPFRIVSKTHIGQRVWGMIAHLVYEGIDPQAPSSLSPKIIQDIIRTRIGFDGFLVSDDLDMDALAAYGDVAERARLTLEAGCDAALYCSGKLPDMERIAKSVPNMTDAAWARLQKSFAVL